MIWWTWETLILKTYNASYTHQFRMTIEPILDHQQKISQICEDWDPHHIILPYSRKTCSIFLHCPCTWENHLIIKCFTIKNTKKHQWLLNNDWTLHENVFYGEIKANHICIMLWLGNDQSWQGILCCGWQASCVKHKLLKPITSEEQCNFFVLHQALGVLTFTWLSKQHRDWSYFPVLSPFNRVTS